MNVPERLTDWFRRVRKIEPGACGDPKCPVLHANPRKPIHPPWWIDSREQS